MFARPHVDTILFMHVMDCGEVEVQHHMCETTINVQQQNAKGSCSHLMSEWWDCMLHMPERSMNLIVEYNLHETSTCCNQVNALLWILWKSQWWLWQIWVPYCNSAIETAWAIDSFCCHLRPFAYHCCTLLHCENFSSPKWHSLNPWSISTGQNTCCDTSADRYNSNIQHSCSCHNCLFIIVFSFPST